MCVCSLLNWTNRVPSTQTERRSRHGPTRTHSQHFPRAATPKPQAHVLHVIINYEQHLT